MNIHLDKNPLRLVRLRKRADFLRVRSAGQTVVMCRCIIQYAPQDAQDDSANSVRIGFTATKKIGKATIRNRAKRRLRAIIADKNLQLKSGYDIVLIARASTPHCSWDKLLLDVKQGLEQAQLIYKQG